MLIGWLTVEHDARLFLWMVVWYERVGIMYVVQDQWTMSSVWDGCRKWYEMNGMVVGCIDPVEF